MLKRILQWDRELFIYLNNLGLEQYDLFWSIATNITTWTPLFILFIVLIIIKQPRRKALVQSIAVILLLGFVLLATNLTKDYVARLRPNNNEEINSLIRILKSPTNYSFFSGHAATSFAITTLVFLFLRRKANWVWIFYIWPLVFSLSRIYVGVHYPVDILVGAFVGTATAFMFYAFYKKIIEPYTMSGHPL